MKQHPSQSDIDDFQAPKALFWTALAVRVAYITFAHSYRVSPLYGHFEFGWETGSVAASLVSGHGYGSPFTGATGPTAWMVPGYTLLMAGVFKLFGTYTPLSAWTILVVNSIAQALAAPMMYEIGARVAGRRNGLWSGWIWALWPGIIQYAVRWIWETSISTVLFIAVLQLGLKMRGTGSQGEPRLRGWITFGLLWAAIWMFNPTLLLMAPIQGIWILHGYGTRSARIRGIRLAALSAGVCLAAVSPWVIRNAMVFHAFIPTRDNLGAEMAVAWSPHSNGFQWGATVSYTPGSADHERYARMGELAYVRMRGKLAREWAAQYPAHFWKMVALRVYMYWTGMPHVAKSWVVEAIRMSVYCVGSITGLLGLLLALRRKLPASGLFACCIVLLPVVYYFITVGSRFRHPLEPILLVMTVYLFQQAEPRWGFSVFHKRSYRDAKAVD